MTSMTREERFVWRATYAASFAASLRSQQPQIHDQVFAIRAIEAADRAVKALRDRRSTGDPRAGKTLVG